MTSDGDALFRAICEQPWEDTPRLMYADWLDESGTYNGRADPAEARLRAAFIRHQIAMARGDQQALAAHPTLMFGTFHGCINRWATAELPSLPDVFWDWQFFPRGFVPGASFETAGAFVTHAARAFAAAPLARVSLYQMSELAFPTVLASELFQRVTALDLSGQFGDPGATHLAGCPHLGRLTELRLVGVGLTDTGLEALTRSTNLPALEVLSFGANRITDRGAAELLRPHALGALKVIGWKGNPLSRETVLALRKRYRDTYTGPPPA